MASFSRRPVTLGRFTTTLRMHLGCCQPRCLPQCLLAHTCFPHRLDRDPHSLRLFRLAERSSPEMQLEWRTSTRLSESPCLTGLKPRALDLQTSAARPRLFSDVQFSLKTGILHLGVFRWTDPNGGQNGGQTHSQTK
jgi:hypothetical protein